MESIMRQFNAIKNAVNFGKGKNTMNKFNEQKQIEETTEFQDSEVMNELNNEIQVNDKVKWIGFRGDTEIKITGTVESIGEFNGKKTFTVRKHGTFPEERTQTMISASRVSRL